MKKGFRVAERKDRLALLLERLEKGDPFTQEWWVLVQSAVQVCKMSPGLVESVREHKNKKPRENPYVQEILLRIERNV